MQNVVKTNFDYFIDEIIEKMNGTTYSTSGKFQEGGVIRPLVDTRTRSLVSFKIISNKFLMKLK